MELRILLDTKREARRTVVIIGGGFSGAAIAHHLDRRAPGLARIVVVEPRASLGAGLAYSTEDPAHRINVPASRMSLNPEQPQHFENWLVETGALRDDPESRLADGRSFPRRTLFGRYVGEQLSEAISVGRLEHRRDSVTKVTPRTDGYGVSLSKGETLEATIVIIASTHPPSVRAGRATPGPCRRQTIHRRALSRQRPRRRAFKRSGFNRWGGVDHGRHCRVPRPTGT